MQVETLTSTIPPLSDAALQSALSTASAPGSSGLASSNPFSVVSPAFQDASSLVTSANGDNANKPKTSIDSCAPSSVDSKGKANGSYDSASLVQFTPLTDVAEDTDEEEDEKIPLPQIVLSGDGENSTGGNNADGNEHDGEEDLSWAAYPPPAALTEVIPDDLPEVLREIARSSVETLQARLAKLVAARAAQDEKAAAEAKDAANRERETQKGKEPEGKIHYFDWPHARESTPAEVPNDTALPDDKGKSADMGVPEDPRPTIRQPSPSAAARRKRRRNFASRLLGIAHVDDRGYGAESSAMGAVAGLVMSNILLAPAAPKRAAIAAPTRTAPAPPLPTIISKKTLGSEPSVGSSFKGPMDLKASTSMTSSTTAAPVIAESRSSAMLMGVLKREISKNKVPVAPQTTECISCFDDIPVKEAVKTVCHSYCLECFRMLVTTALDNEAQFPPKCCLNEVPAKTVLKYLPRDLGKRYSTKADEFSLPVAERIYCPHADCGLFVPKSHQSPAAHIARCRSGHESCTICRQPAHGTGSRRQPCPEDRDQIMADELAADEGWRRCIDCGVMIEHRDACQHMTCRCGGQFCYVCGTRWRTCRCSLNDLHRVKREAEERHAVRMEREQAAERARAAAAAQADRELAELREALRLVEEFEREEARKLEQRQRAHRRRLQALKEQREAELRLAVAAKYEALRTTLAGLAQVQRAAAQQQRRDERAGRAQADAASLSELCLAHASERAAASAAAQQRVAEAEAAWDRDYRARVRLEQTLEAAYREALASLWKGRQDEAARRAACLKEYMRRNDGRLQTYLRWRDRELDTARFLAEEERCVRGELLDRARTGCIERQAQAGAEQKRRHAGERMWLRAVGAEQRRLLAEMEQMEAGLGLEASTADVDADLLMLLELERSGGLSGVEMEYSMMLLGDAGVEEAEAVEEAAGGGDSADSESVYMDAGEGSSHSRNRSDSSSSSSSYRKFLQRYNQTWDDDEGGC